MEISPEQLLVVIKQLTKTNEQQTTLIEKLMAEIQSLSVKLEELTDLLFKQKSEKTRYSEEKMPRVKPNKKPLTEEEKKAARERTNQKRKQNRDK